jgi:bifunctional non-homologous end joining protein LigD
MTDKTPVVRGKSRSAVYVEPTLAAEIEYRAWTSDGKLRHASFKGIRDPSDDVSIYELPD